MSTPLKPVTARINEMALKFQREKMTEKLREELERQDRDEARERDFQVTLGLAF